MAIKLLDDLGVADAVYQWDTNRRVMLTEDDRMATRVDFNQYGSRGQSISAFVYENKDGQVVADIPNILLQEDRDIVCFSVKEVTCGKEDLPVGRDYRRCGNGLYSYSETISDERIEVIGRNRPPDYVFRPTETTWEGMKKWVKKELRKTTDYNALRNKPKINGVVVQGNVKVSVLGGTVASEQDIDKMFEDKE